MDASGRPWAVACGMRGTDGLCLRTGLGRHDKAGRDQLWQHLANFAPARDAARRLRLLIVRCLRSPSATRASPDPTAPATPLQRMREPGTFAVRGWWPEMTGKTLGIGQFDLCIGSFGAPHLKPHTECVCCIRTLSEVCRSPQNANL